MDSSYDRRELGRRFSGALGGLAVGALCGHGQAGADNTDKSSGRLLLLGLNGLARAHKFDYFADGHRAASMVAAYLMCRNNRVDQAAEPRIAELFDLNWAPSPLCEPFPEEDAQPQRIAEIGNTLAERGDTLLQVGHNAIFAMLATKALKMVPAAATPQRIEGVCALIRSFTPWRDIKPAADVAPPPFVDAVASARFILREAISAIDRFIGFGQGFAGHMLTFGQSLVELAAMGHIDWAESCRPAFCKYVTVTRQGPGPDAKRYKDHAPHELRPVDAEYWKRRGNKSLGLGHVFKYPYSCYELLRLAADADLQRAWEEKAYHLF